MHLINTMYTKRNTSKVINIFSGSVVNPDESKLLILCLRASKTLLSWQPTVQPTEDFYSWTIFIGEKRSALRSAPVLAVKAAPCRNVSSVWYKAASIFDFDKHTFSEPEYFNNKTDALWLFSCSSWCSGVVLSFGLLLYGDVVHW